MSTIGMETFRVGNHRSLLDSYPDLLLIHGNTLAWTHGIKINLIYMLSSVIRSSWRFALIFLHKSFVAAWRKFRQIWNQWWTSKNNIISETGVQNKTGSWRLKAWNSLVHAIILSLNWLLLFEHFSAGGVPLWRSKQSICSSASRGGFGHLPFYLPPLATAVALCIFPLNSSFILLIYYLLPQVKCANFFFDL